MTKSRVLKKLRSGDYARIAGISRLPDPWLAEVVGRIGYDVIWYDLEHREFAYDTILPMSLACRYTGMDLMVRIRKHGYDSVMRALEFGAINAGTEGAIAAAQYGAHERAVPGSSAEIPGEIASAGASLVAVSPQTEKQAFFMNDQHKLAFPLLVDAHNQLARQFGLVYRVPEEQQGLYSRTFVNLPFVNGDASWELPIPATVVVDRDGSMLFASADEDYTNRPEPLDILAAITKMKSHN